MIRRLFRFALKLGVIASLAAAALKALDRRRSASSASDWSTGTEPWPPIDLSDQPAPEPVPAPSAADATTSVAPAETAPDGTGATIAGETGGQPETVGAQGAWEEPDDGGICPPSHPVKAKLSSKVFHLPGMANYERTKADRCYLDADAAEADGLRQAKR